MMSWPSVTNSVAWSRQQSSSPPRAHRWGTFFSSPKAVRPRTRWPRVPGPSTRSGPSRCALRDFELSAPPSSGTFLLPMRLAACTRALCAPSAPNRHAARRPPAAATAGPLPHRRRAGGNRCPPRLVSARPAVAAAASAAAVAVQPAGDALVVSTDFLVRDIARGAVAAASGLCASSAW
jgi:hypothetical protein